MIKDYEVLENGQPVNRIRVDSDNENWLTEQFGNNWREAPFKHPVQPADLPESEQTGGGSGETS